MAALPPDQLAARIAAGTLYAKYAQTVDPQSAHEIITARILAAEAAALAGMGLGMGAGGTGGAGGSGGYGSGGYGDAPNVTLGDQISTRQRAQVDAAQRAAQREADRQAREQARQQAAAEREAARTQRQREKEIAQIGNTVLRGVLGTLLGRRR